MGARCILLILSLMSGCFVVRAEEGWSHIDYGSANVIPGERNVEMSETRLASVIATLNRMVSIHGSRKGVFYVNDAESGPCNAAALFLQDYARQKGYNVEIRSLPGRFEALDSSEIPFTDTATLANPEGVLLREWKVFEAVVDKLRSRTKTLSIDTSAEKQLDGWITHIEGSKKVEEPVKPYHRPDGTVNLFKPVYRFQVPGTNFQQIPPFGKRPLHGSSACELSLESL